MGTLSYLKQNDFNVKKAVDFENYEKTRTLKALVRLFKCMQLLPLTQSNPEKKDKKKKARVMAGLLFYFVCPSSSAAENLLRKFCQFCEAEGESEEVKDIHQKMFRKDDSRKGDQAEDRLKRQRLCSGEP